MNDERSQNAGEEMLEDLEAPDAAQAGVAGGWFHVVMPLPPIPVSDGGPSGNTSNAGKDSTAGGH